MRENTEQKNSEYGHFWRSGINLFHATGLYPYPLKIPENQRFSDVFKDKKDQQRFFQWSLMEFFCKNS